MAEACSSMMAGELVGAVGLLQLLQLSRVEWVLVLICHSIPMVLDLLVIDQNLLKHFECSEIFKLYNSKRGLSLAHLNLSVLCFF